MEEAAKTSVTVFLILVGMMVVVFVEPPLKLLAVIEPLSPDWRPTWLALSLTGALGVVLLVPPFRDFFNLYPLSIRDLSITLGGALAWAVLVWIAGAGASSNASWARIPRPEPHAPATGCA